MLRQSDRGANIISTSPSLSKSTLSVKDRGLVKTHSNSPFISLGILLDLKKISDVSGIRTSFLPDSFFDDEGALGADVSRKSFAFENPTFTVTESTRPVTFCTGSKYVGPTNALGMQGKGIYKYPHGVIYDGYFNRKGDFHGTGTLVYPNGQRIEGLWRNGKMIKGANFVSTDKSTFDRNYCKIPDRRYVIEMRTDVQAAGQEYLTNSHPPQKIPEGMYDTGEGFYDPKKRIVIDYTDTTKSKSLVQLYENDMDRYDLLEDEKQTKQIRAAKQQEIKRTSKVQDVPIEVKERWVQSHCRKAWDEPTGFQPQLYETWTPGYKKDRPLQYETTPVNNHVDDLLDYISQAESTKISSNFFTFVSKAPNTFAKIVDLKTRKLAKKSTSVEHLANMFKSSSDKVTTVPKRPRKRKRSKPRSNSVW